MQTLPSFVAANLDAMQSRANHLAELARSQRRYADDMKALAARAERIGRSQDAEALLLSADGAIAEAARLQAESDRARVGHRQCLNWVADLAEGTPLAPAAQGADDPAQRLGCRVA